MATIPPRVLATCAPCKISPRRSELGGDAMGFMGGGGYAYIYLLNIYYKSQPFM